jgi:hypothetical protein
MNHADVAVTFLATASGTFSFLATTTLAAGNKDRVRSEILCTTRYGAETCRNPPPRCQRLAHDVGKNFRASSNFHEVGNFEFRFREQSFE